MSALEQIFSAIIIGMIASVPVCTGLYIYHTYKMKKLFKDQQRQREEFFEKLRKHHQEAAARSQFEARQAIAKYNRDTALQMSKDPSITTSYGNATQRRYDENDTSAAALYSGFDSGSSYSSSDSSSCDSSSSSYSSCD